MRHLGQLLGGLLVLGYPLLVWIVLHRSPARGAGWSLAIAGAVLVGLRLFGMREGLQLRELIARFWTLLLPIAFAVGTGLTGRAELLLLTPVAINLGLFVAFVHSLRSQRGPMIERFARMIDPDLGPAERTYCRTVTVVWSVFFLANAIACAVLAITASLEWWAAYTGGIAYALMGLLFTIEFIVRKLRFRRYSDAPLDRLFARFFPPS